MSDMDCEQSPHQGSDVIDLPEDFFDDFAKEEFLAGLDVVDNWSDPKESGEESNPEDEEPSSDRSPATEDRLRRLLAISNMPSTSRRDTKRDKESDKVSSTSDRKIARNLGRIRNHSKSPRRRQRSSRSPSPTNFRREFGALHRGSRGTIGRGGFVRSPMKRRGSSADRRSSGERRNSVDRRISSVEQRQRIRRERQRSRSRSRKRTRSRSNSRGIRSRHSGSAGRSLTFLEELAQTFAAKGQPFPEGEKLAQLKSNDFLRSQGINPDSNSPTIPNNYFGAPSSYQPPDFIQNFMNPQMMMRPGMDPAMYNQHMATQMNFIPNVPFIQPTYQQNQFGVFPQGMVNPPNPILNDHFPGRPPLPAPLPPQPIKVMEPPKKKIPTDAEARLQRARTLFRCQEAISFLKQEDKQLVKRRILFNPMTYIKETTHSSYQSPLSTPNNVIFGFSSTMKRDKNCPIKFLSPAVAAIVRTLGMKGKEIIRKMHVQIEHEVKPVQAETKPVEKEEQPILQYFVDGNTQTDDIQCDKCIALEFKIFENQACQTNLAPDVESRSTQTTTDDDFLIREIGRLRPSQVTAICDYVALITDLPPVDQREQNALWQRLMTIYENSQADIRPKNRPVFERLGGIEDTPPERRLRDNPGWEEELQRMRTAEMMANQNIIHPREQVRDPREQMRDPREIQRGSSINSNPMFEIRNQNQNQMQRNDPRVDMNDHNNRFDMLNKDPRHEINMRQDMRHDMRNVDPRQDMRNMDPRQQQQFDNRDPRNRGGGGNEEFIQQQIMQQTNFRGGRNRF